MKVKFLAEFLASLSVGLLAVLTISVGWGINLDTMIIGGVMPLVPGCRLRMQFGIYLLGICLVEWHAERKRYLLLVQ